jgi:hypothetical protein
MSGLRRKPFALRNNEVDMKDFDWEIYLLNYPELVNQGIRTKIDACDHYKKTGFLQKRSYQIPTSFNSERYIRAHGHLGLATPREAYIHFMKIGTVVRKNEGMKRVSQSYRLPIGQPQIRKPVIIQNRLLNKKNNQTTITIQPIPKNPLLRPQRSVPPRRNFNAPVVPTKVQVAQQKRQPASLNKITHTHTKRKVREILPGELVLREPPSSYFARMNILGPPRYLN